MKNPLVIIPNTVTCLNLLAGCLGIIFAFNEQLLWSAWFIGIAAVLDFLDGLLARLLDARSEIGKQLDSLADMVSFGLLPGIILYQLISIGFGQYFLVFPEKNMCYFLLALSGLLVPVFSALRLAKFNIDERQQDHFIGLPTPANAIFIASFPLVLELQYSFNIYVPMTDEILIALKEIYYWGKFDMFFVQLLMNPWFYISISVVMSLLLVVPIRLFSLKLKNLRWKDNKIRYVFVFMVILLSIITALPYLVYIRHFPFIDFLIIPLIVILYLILSLFAHYKKDVK